MIACPRETVGMPWRPLPADEPDRSIRVGEGVDRVLRHLGAPSRDVVTAVFERWREIVGDRLAAHAEPVAVSDGHLVVRVDDPAWGNQLRWLERDVLQRLADVTGAGGVVGLEVRTGDARRRVPRRSTGRDRT